MSDFSLIMFREVKKEQENLRNLLKGFFKWMRCLFIKPNLDNGIKRIAIHEKVSMYLINLPYSIEEAAHNSTRINRFVSAFCLDKNIKYCFLPPKLPQTFQLTGCIKYSFNGKLLLKALLSTVLSDICSSRETEIREIDIAIVEGEDFNELLEVIRILSPLVKFITVLTSNKSSMEEEMNRLYEDTGLCVRVTSEARTSLKNADVIINLGGLIDMIQDAKINPKSVILNYGGEELNNLSYGNIIINGIKISMPAKITSKIGSDIFEYYEKTSISEVILYHMTDNGDRMADGKIDFITAQSISSAFKKNGFGIKEFAGRRNTFSLHEMNEVL